MAKKELINRTYKILVDNKESINPRNYYDSMDNTYKRFHACFIITDEYLVEERVLNRLGIEYTRRTKKKEIHSVICMDENEVNFVLKTFGLYGADKVYVESISSDIYEQNDSKHPENSTITISGTADFRRNAYNKPKDSSFKLSLPLSAPVKFCRIYRKLSRDFFGKKTITYELTAPALMTTTDLLTMINKKYNEVNALSPTLKTIVQPHGVEVSYTVKDTRDLIDEKSYARADRRENRRAETYKPVEFLRKAPGFIKERASSAFDNAYAHVANMKVKNLVIYAVVMALLSAGVGLVKKGYRNYQLEGAQNGFDMFTFDTKHATSKDEDLQIARDTYAPKVTELSNNAKTNLTQKEIEKTSEYMVDVASSGFDNNDSKNIIDLRKMLPARVTDINLRKAQEALADKLQGKVESMIYRPSADKAIEFLDYTLPLALFSEEYVNHPFSTKYFGSSNGNCPTTEEIEIYSSLPDIVKKTVLAQIREVYKKFPGYKFVHPSATPDGKEEKYDVTSHLNNVDGAINFRLLVQASDYVVEPGYRASGGK